MAADLSMEAIRSRLLAVRPEIEKIMSAAGVAGLSYGVVHRGRLVHVDNFGYMNFEKKLPVTDETMFPICSMTKGIVSSVLGMLVEENKLQFDAYVADILHQCWVQSGHNIIIAKEDAMRVINGLKVVADMRTDFTYSNWGYELASEVVRELTGETWDTHQHAWCMLRCQSVPRD